VKDSSDDSRIVAAIPCEDESDIRRLREIRQTRPPPHLLIVMLGRERQRVVDPVVVTLNPHPGAPHTSEL